VGGAKKIFNTVNNAVNKVTKVVDPVGGYLKEYTEQKSQAAVNSFLGNLMGGNQKPANSYEDLGGTSTQAVSEDAMVQDKAKKFNANKQKRQGFSGGSTLITSTEDEDQKMNKNTLLGM
jgi:hypothetical protein